MTEREAPETDQIWTIPNALSVLRLLGVPLFLWLLLGPHQDGWALTVLAVSGFTDWLDGVLARKLNQMSRFGALLDPDNNLVTLYERAPIDPASDQE